MPQKSGSVLKLLGWRHPLGAAAVSLSPQPTSADDDRKRSGRGRRSRSIESMSRVSSSMQPQSARQMMHTVSAGTRGSETTTTELLLLKCRSFSTGAVSKVPDGKGLAGRY